MFLKLPKPETKSALLVPASGPRRATLHRYVRTELATKQPRRHDKEPSRGFAFIFECEDTGAERQWGFEKLGGEGDAP